MAIVEWDSIPFSIVSQFGTLNLNASTGDRYLIDHNTSSAGADLRVTIDNIPAGDGGIVHDPFQSYYAVTLSMNLFKDDKPACATDLNRMYQTFALHALGMLHTDGRLIWTPTGYPQRLLDNVRLSARPTATQVSEVMVQLVAGFASPFPYAITATQTTTSFAVGATHTITNDGTEPTYPVVKVFGATSAFSLVNNETGLLLSYNASLPGASPIAGGDYVEIDMFRGTAYLNGSGANRKSGIDLIASDFWPITPKPSGNSITVLGASADFLWNQAWG